MKRDKLQDFICSKFNEKHKDKVIEKIDNFFEERNLSYYDDKIPVYIALTLIDFFRWNYSHYLIKPIELQEALV